MNQKQIARMVVGFALCLVMVACTQPSPTPSTPTPDAPTSTVRPSSPTPESALPQEPTHQPLSPFTADLGSPFAQEVTLTTWDAQTYGGSDPTLPVDLSRINNPEVIAGLTGDQRAFLSQNGFVILHTQEEQFGSIGSK